MRRVIWGAVIALALFVLWLMVSVPTRQRYWDMIYPRTPDVGSR